MSEPLSFNLQARDDGLERLLRSVNETLGDLVGGLNKVESAANAGFRDVEQVVQSTRKSVDDATRSATDWSKVWDKTKTIAAGVGTYVASMATGLAVLTQHVTSNAAEVDRWAQRLGVSTDWLSRMQFAAGSVGLDLDGLGEALANTSEKLSEAATQGGDSAMIFQELGISLRDSTGHVRDIDAVMPELADKLRGVSSDSDRVRLAMALFGEEGSRIVPILMQGSEGLAAMQDKAGMLGVALSGKLVQDSRTFQAGLNDVKTALQGTGNAIIAQLLPSVNEVLPKITAFTIQLKDSSMVQATLLPLLQATAEALGGVAGNLGVIEREWNRVNAAFNTVVAWTLQGIGWLTESLADLMKAVGSVAHALRLPGVGNALFDVANNIRTAAEEAKALGKIAAETADDWQKRNVSTAKSLETVTSKTDATTNAVQDLGNAAATTGRQVQGAMQTVEDAVGDIRDAFTDLGLQSPIALKRAVDVGIASFKTIAAAAGSSAFQVQQAWEALRARLIALYGTVPKEFAAIEAAIKAGNFATARAMIANFDGTIQEVAGLYNKLPAAMQPGNDAIVAGTTRAAEATVGVWRGAVTPIMQSYDATLQAIRDLNDATGQGIRRATELTKAALQDVAVAATNAFFAATKGAEERIAQLRDFVSKQLGPAPQGIEFQIGNTLAEVEAQYTQIVAALRNVGQDIMGSNWAATQRQTLQDLLARLEIKLLELRARGGGGGGGLLGTGGGLQDILLRILGTTPGLLGSGIPLLTPAPGGSQMLGPIITALPPRDTGALPQVTGGAGGGTGIGTPGFHERPIDFGFGGSRSSLTQHLHVDVRYTGTQNARLLANDIAGELEELQRRGRFRIGSGSQGGRPG